MSGMLEIDEEFPIMTTINATSTLSQNLSNIPNNDFPTDFTIFDTWAILLFYFVYIAILLFGVPGNILTCVVIVSRRSMRRSIHFYAFNLAVCDLLILFFYIPTQLAYIGAQMKWKMGLAMCKVSYFVLPVTLYSSIGTLLAITIDRARGLLQPFKWRSDSRRSAKIAIPIIWCVSLILSIPLFIVPLLHTYEDGMTTCTEKWPSEIWSKAYWIGMFVICFAVPLNFIFIIHIIMLIVITKETNKRNRHYNTRMIRMTIAVVLVFSVCTGYQHIYYFMEITKSTAHWTISKLALFYCFGNFVVSLQAAINPVIYGTFRKDFYKAFKTTIIKLLVLLKMHRNEIKKCRSMSLYTSVENIASEIWTKDKKIGSFTRMSFLRKSKEEKYLNNNSIKFCEYNNFRKDNYENRFMASNTADSSFTTPATIHELQNTNNILYLPSLKNIPENQSPFSVLDEKLKCHASSHEEPTKFLLKGCVAREEVNRTVDDNISDDTRRLMEVNKRHNRKTLQYRVSFAKLFQINDDMATNSEVQFIPEHFCQALESLRETNL